MEKMKKDEFDQIFDLMNNLKKEYNTAIMMITHNMGVVAEMADEVAGK